MNFDNVYSLCNKLGYFSYGSAHSYERMFDLVRDGAPVEVVAAVIWACSDNDAQLDEITKQLANLK